MLNTIGITSAYTISMSKDKVKAELVRLSGLLGKYAHRFNGGENHRMQGWIYQYDQLIDKYPEAFNEYCLEMGHCPTHSGNDNLA